MLFQKFQMILMPVSFGLLFSLMLVYWSQAAIFSYTKYTKLTRILFFFCLASLTFLLIGRFLDSGHLPFSNLYESLLFLSWSFLIIQLGLQINCHTINSFNLQEQGGTVNDDFSRSISTPNQKTGLSGFDFLSIDKNIPATLEDQFSHFVGVMTSPLSFLTYTFAFLNLPKEMQKATALVPALQSNWLMMHVTVMILSYAALLCGSLLSMAFLFVNFFEKREVANQPNPQFLQPAVLGESIEANQNDPFHTKRISSENRSVSLSLADKLDNYSYRILALGFPLLTVGILSGAVWANQAWGSYWSWDPKESWALITWLVFAIYLHTRITKGWSGQKPAMVATLGFFVVWFCYLGVNLLGTGLHSYGWFSK